MSDLTGSPILGEFNGVTVRRIDSLKDSIKYGKKRGWCTSRPGNTYYENTYSMPKGQLYMFYEADSPRPRYQLFLSRTGTMEFRKNGNKYDDFMAYSAYRPELRAYIEELHEDIRVPTMASVDKALSSYVSGMQDRMFGLPQADTDVSASIPTSVGHFHNLEEFLASNLSVGAIGYLADERSIYCVTDEGAIPITGGSTGSHLRDMSTTVDNGLITTDMDIVATDEPSLRRLSSVMRDLPLDAHIIPNNSIVRDCNVV